MKIAIFGWCGHGALADDILIYATADYIRNLGHEVFTGPWPDDLNECIDIIKTCDHLVFGGGSLICPLKLHPIMHLSAFVDLRKPLHLFGTGFRQESEILAADQRRLNRFLFSNLDTSIPRGHFTRDQLNVNGIVRTHDDFGDPGVLKKVHKGKKLNLGTGTTVGIVVRNMPDGEVKHVQNRFIHSYFILLIRALNEQFDDLHVHFMSMRHVREEYDNDSYAAEYIASQNKMIPQTIHKPVDYNDAARLIASMDMVVSQRLHPTVVALANRVPAVGMEYQFGKMYDFASIVDFQYYFHTANLTKPSGRDDAVANTITWLQSQYEGVFNECEKLRKKLRGHLRDLFPTGG